MNPMYWEIQWAQWLFTHCNLTELGREIAFNTILAKYPMN